ncbi:MAG: insulinase family protein [Thermoanaerobaculia bacterium]|nr:insulinase family protein [Thermoanaerobaculia bacterium]
MRANKFSKAVASIASLGVLALVSTAGAAEVAKHPRDLKFGPLDFEVPDATAARHELSNGVPVYVVEDHALPLVDINLTFRAGAFLDDESNPGVASLTGTLLRQGGTQSISAEDFDERVDFLAANISSGSGDTSSSASLDCLSTVLDPSLDLFFDMLMSPGFDADRLQVVKSSALEQMKQRNDDPRSIAGREWQWLLFGEDHFSSRSLTAAELEAIDSDDLAAFHRRYWRPDQLVIAVSGDVDTKAILANLESRLAAWPTTTDLVPVPWPPAAPSFTPTPGIYHVEKEIPQGRVSLGHLTESWSDWSDPEAYAAMVMNDILGGGGFTSRLVKRIRSDEGLAYSAGSSYSRGVFWPGVFSASYQSKNSTVALAAAIALEEISRIQSEPVSEVELRTAKASFVDTFPRRFESASSIAGTFAGDEYIGRPHDYWTHFRDRIGAVDQAAVQKAAQDLLHPEKLVLLAVGPWDEIGPGDADGRANMGQLLDGEVHHLPLRDPLTLEPMP